MNTTHVLYFVFFIISSEFIDKQNHPLFIVFFILILYLR